MRERSQTAATRVLVVDDDTGARAALGGLLRADGYDVATAADGYKALDRAEEWVPNIVITDVKMPALGGIELMRRLKERLPDVAVVVVTGLCSVEGAVEAMQQGADDYMSKPLDFAHVREVLERVRARQALVAEANRLRQAMRSHAPEPGGDFIGQSRDFREVRALADELAAATIPVLFTGECGTGKQTLARKLHQSSGRRGPLVSVACGNADAATLDGSLFAAEGPVATAKGGTLLLVGIDELPLHIQGRVTQLMKEGSFVPDGVGEPIDADVRILATSRRDLAAETSRGRFREDLRHRLGAATLHMPALRERRDDIPLLVTHFITRHARLARKRIVGCSERALKQLFGFSWPGNISQLEYCVERAVTVAQSSEIEPKDLPRELLSAPAGREEVPSIPGASLEEIERYAILRTLEQAGGNNAKAAKILGISVRKIQYRLNEYGGTA